MKPLKGRGTLPGMAPKHPAGPPGMAGMAGTGGAAPPQASPAPSVLAPLGGPGSRAALINAAREHLTGERTDAAEKILAPLVSRSKRDAEAICLLAIVHERRRNISRAEELARKSVEIAEHPQSLLVLARCMKVRGKTDEAVRLCDRALARAPGMPGARTLKGGALEEAGRYDEAEAVILPLVKELTERGDPVDPSIRFEAAKLHVQKKRFDEAMAEMDVIVATTPAGELRRLTLYLKAKARDRMKDYNGAYEAAAAANDIGRLEFSPDLYAEQVGVLIENWSREKMTKFPVSQCMSELPVFVAGMPRSGTSLIDQIIDAHPKAAGVGELSTIEMFAHQLTAAWNPEKEPPASFGKFDSWKWTRAAEAYVKEIRGLAAPGVQRIVNKSLGNNKLVGLIARLFPRTRIIHALRDPRDVAVSCFQGGFNNALHPWTTRYEWIARAWEQSQRMMDHWKNSLDVPILDVHYERLVKHPETEFPRIIEFLGLEWDAACTKFHESKRTVRTLSYDQVNRPLYTTSAGRNANYAPFMEGIEFPPYDPGV